MPSCSPLTDNYIKNIVISIWLVLLGASLSLSLAIANILIGLGFVYLLILHTALIKNILTHRITKTFLIAALLFQCAEWAYDGWVIAKASKVILLFIITFIIGFTLNIIHVRWLPWLLGGLILGLVVGTPLNHYLNPEYPLWATYSMTYANQASGFVITVGLLSIATKKWVLIIPVLLSMFFYLYMTGERASIPALILSCMVLLAILRHYKSLIICIVIIAGAWIYLYDASPSNNSSPNIRLDLWQHGLLIAQKDIFLGRGEQHTFTLEELNLYKTYATGAGKAYLQHTMPKQEGTGYNMAYHNQLVHFLVEYGVIGSLIFLIFLIFPLIQAWKNRSLSYEQSAFIMLWSAFAVHSMVETAFDAHSAIILGLLAGLMKTFIIPDTPKKLRLTVPEIS